MSAISHRTRTFVLLVVMVWFNSIGDVFLSKGMRAIGPVEKLSFAAIQMSFRQVFSTGTIWLGIACLLAGLVSYLLVLNWADFSYIMPTSASGYGLVSLLGYFMLGESVSPTRWAGIFIICAGVVLVGRTSPKTTVAT